MATEKKKHLHELLEADQEPFHLNHYISDLRSQMGYSDLRLKKQQSQNVAVSCESSCYLQVPARTAAVLLEAAARIQKKQTNKSKNRAQNRGNAFGVFGTVLKRLTNLKAKPRLENTDGNAVLSEPTCSSMSRREGLVETGDKCFCESPFHFVLHSTPSTSGHRTPHFTSPVTSPAQCSTEDEDSDDTHSLEKVRGQEHKGKEEEDKEQCSPVSVLDPLEEEEDEEDHHQGEPNHLNLFPCSFEVVERAKRRLLKKLGRFKKLEGMDPEEEEEYDESDVRVYDSDEDYEDVDEVMARESACMEEKRRMMNAWNVDVVVHKDIREEAREWTRHGGEVEETVSDLELSIFFFLIDELSHELVYSPP